MTRESTWQPGKARGGEAAASAAGAHLDSVAERRVHSPRVAPRSHRHTTSHRRRSCAVATQDSRTTVVHDDVPNTGPTVPQRRCV
jgi:hypothetical protein